MIQLPRNAPTHLLTPRHAACESLFELQARIRHVVPHPGAGRGWWRCWGDFREASRRASRWNRCRRSVSLATVAAALACGFANAEVTWGRLDRAGVEAIVATGLDAQMKAFGVWGDWAAGCRGRQAE